MTGTAKIHSISRIEGQHWAVTLVKLSEDFSVKTGDLVIFEKNGFQIPPRPVVKVELEHQHNENQHIRTIVQAYHAHGVSLFEGGTATVRSD